MAGFVQTNMKSVRHIPVVVSGDASGDGNTVVDCGGEIRAVKLIAATTGAYLKVEELITNDGSNFLTNTESDGGITLTGNVIAESIITGSKTIRPLVNAHNVSGAATANVTEVYQCVDYVNCVIASGGITSGGTVHLYVG